MSEDIMDASKEIEAIRLGYEALKNLDVDALDRAVNYIMDRINSDRKTAELNPND